MKNVEYIESSGGQYIDTGYIVKKNTKLVMRCNVQEEYQWAAPFGVRAGESNQAFQYCARDNSTQVGVICFGTFSEIKVSQPSSVYNNDIEISLSNNLFTIKSVLNGEVLVNHPFTQSGALSETLSLYFFTLNQGGRDIGNLCWTNMKLYGCEIYEDETLVKLYKPMLDDSEVPCLYEGIDKEILYNVGSGVFTHGAIIAQARYLIYADGTYYTILDGSLTSLQITDLSKQAFVTYGMEDPPTSEILLTLNNPKVLAWSDEEQPHITAKITATPYPQTLYSPDYDMTDATILGIEKVIAVASDDVTFSVSFDSGETWKYYTGTDWATLSEETSGMTAETIMAVPTDKWGEVATTGHYMVRATLPGVESTLESFVVDYINK